MTTQELKQYIDKVLGNSIRCLLPSYWWKRLFTSLADRVDEVEQSTSQLIDSKVEEVNMPIVESIDELDNLKLAKGRVAAVEKTGESATVKISDCYLSYNWEEDWDKYTIVKGVEEKDVIIDKDVVASVMFSASKETIDKDALQVSVARGIFYYVKIADGEPHVTFLEEVNKALSSGKYRAIFGFNDHDDCFIDDYFTFYSEKPQPSLYIKGDSWERLAKESDLVGIEGGSGDDNVVTFYAPTDISSISDTEKQHNAESYQKIAEGFETDKYYDVKVLMSTTQLVIFDAIQILNPAIDDGKLKLLFRWVSDNREQILTVTSDGSATKETKESHFDSELSETSENAVQNKAVTNALNNKADKSQIPTKLSQLEKDIEIGSSITVDSELSETSTNPVQNKVVKSYVDNAIANAIINTLNTEV